MLRTRLLIPFLLAGAVLTAEPTRPIAPLEPVLDPYEELDAHPERHLGETIRFAFTLQSKLETWNPYLTRFGTSDFDCVRGWSDESFPWVRADYENPSIRLFLREGTRAQRVANLAKPYTRFVVTGVVRELFAGAPWIEVTELKRLEASLNEGTVLHAERGMRELEAEKFTLAIENFERARVGILPQVSADELDRLIAKCRAGLAAAGTSE